LEQVASIQQLAILTHDYWIMFIICTSNKHVLLTNCVEHTVIREESLGIGPTFVECFYFQSSI